MSARHTPGPWTFGQVRTTGIYDLIGPDVTGKGREIVGDFRASQCRETNNANARLIASAPELLAAAVKLLGHAEWVMSSVPNGQRAELAAACKVMSEAIAKAKGGAA